MTRGGGPGPGSLLMGTERTRTLSRGKKSFGAGGLLLGGESCQPSGVSAVCSPPGWTPKVPAIRISALTDKSGPGGLGCIWSGELPVGGGMQA